MKLGEFFVELLFKTETKKVKDFAKTIGDLPVTLVAAGAALVGMDLSFMALTSSTMDMGNALMMFHAQTGETTDFLERWEMAGRRVNVQNEAVSGSFQKMMGIIAQLNTYGTGPAGQLFGRLHINGFRNKSPDQLMTELRAQYLSLHSPEAIQKFWQVAGSLISPDMARVFEGPDPKKMSPLLGEDGTKATADLTYALSRMTDYLRGDFLQLFKGIEPDLKEIADDLGILAGWIGKFIHAEFQGIAGIKGAMHDKLGLNAALDNVIDYWFPTAASRGWLWKPAGNQGVTVHQNFYGDVDKADIDNGNLNLEHSLIRTSRMLNKGGR